MIAIDDCRTCPQCTSKKTIALNDTWRRCTKCRHVFRRRNYPTYDDPVEAQRNSSKHFATERG